MEDDARCCGTGHCMINAQGQCWCGQQWDGTKMCFAPKAGAVPHGTVAPQSAVVDAKTHTDATSATAAHATQTASYSHAQPSSEA